LFTAFIAERIIRLHPEYHPYSNNCQNFVRYLLEFACPECDAPKTIQETLEGILADFQLKKRNFEQFESGHQQDRHPGKVSGS